MQSIKIKNGLCKVIINYFKLTYAKNTGFCSMINYIIKGHYYKTEMLQKILKKNVRIIVDLHSSILEKTSFIKTYVTVYL